MWLSMEPIDSSWKKKVEVGGSLPSEPQSSPYPLENAAHYPKEAQGAEQGVVAAT